MSRPARDELDAELMQNLAGGDDLALNHLMQVWSQPLISYLMRLTGNHTTSCDLAQESFVRVYRHRLEYRVTQKFSNWLFAIATNLARNQARWHSRHPEALTEPEEFCRISIDGSIVPPDEQTAVNEGLAALQKAVAELPNDMREIVILSTWHGYSHAEIARVQATTAKAVEVRLYRARKLLREKLAEYLVL